MTETETRRLEDFKKILTYHLVTKIKHHFNGDFKAYYDAPKIWIKWRNYAWDYKKANPYAYIAKFNDTALTARQVQHIFGKYEDGDNKGKWIRYENLIAGCPEITTMKKGTVVAKGRRYQFAQRYMLPYETIAAIFNDEKLLEKVVDASSDFYTDRQRRLIFTQINKQKRYKYKTRKQAAEEEDAERILREMEADGLI